MTWTEHIISLAPNLQRSPFLSCIFFLLNLQPVFPIFQPHEATYNSKTWGSQANCTKGALLNSAITETDSVVRLISKSPNQPAHVSFWCTSATPAALSWLLNTVDSPLTVWRSIFFWLLLHDRVNTRNLLHRKSFHLPSYNCELCHSNTEETSLHLFWDCDFAFSCWESILGHRHRGVSLLWGDNTFSSSSPHTHCYGNLNHGVLEHLDTEEWENLQITAIFHSIMEKTFEELSADSTAQNQE